MPPRANNDITMMVAQAQQKMRELKELQFFGGDSLNLKRWAHTQSIPLDSVMHCWRVVIVPDDPATTMPFSAQIKPADAISFVSGQVEPVHRTDGSYEYLFIINAEYPDGPAQTARFVIEYSGTATINISMIG